MYFKVIKSGNNRKLVYDFLLVLSSKKYHQYADDTQLRLSMHADNTAEGLAVLAACTTDVRQWYMQNGLQLNQCLF